MNKVSKKTLKLSKKTDTKLEKKVKSTFQKATSKKVSDEIINNLKELRDNVDTKDNDIVMEEKCEDIPQTNEKNLSNFSVKTSVPNKRVIIVKNINKDSKIEDVLSHVKNTDDIIKSSSIKVRNRGVKTQMLTIEFGTAHCTNGLIDKLNKTVIDGNNLFAEYKYTVVDSSQRESKTKTNTFIIKNLPLSTTKESIKELISDFDVSGKNFQLFRKFGKNCCFIHFNSIKKATEAFEVLKETVVEGVKLDIKFVSEKKETEDEKLSNTTLHITNIPFTAKKELIEKEFDMADSIRFPLTSLGKSKGCCYLLFKSGEMVALAMEALQSKTIEGRMIRCEYANANVVIEEKKKCEEELPVESKKRTRSKKDKTIGLVMTLFNLPNDVTTDDIMGKFENVQSVNILKKNNVFKGIADVMFADKSSAKAALSTPECSIKGRVIRKELKGKKVVAKTGVKTTKKSEAMEM